MPSLLKFAALAIFIVALSPFKSYADNSNFQGQYFGNISGQSATLTLNRKGNFTAGEINVSGYIYKVQGSIQGTSLTGVFSDPNTGGQGNLSASQQAQNIILKIVLPGQYQPLVLNFRRSGKSQENVARPLIGQNKTQTNINQIPVQRDPALVGSWSKTDSYTSGEFSAATQFFLTIAADGRYRYGDGKFAGGIGGVSGTSSGGDAEIGEWKTENRIVYIRQNSQQQWQPYARYYVEGYSLMFTFANGSREIWKRR